MFRIGEFSQLSQVSIRMLRHYDAMDVLRPAHVDAATGYRYYSVEQLTDVNRIVALRDLGLGVATIRRLVREHVSAEQLTGVLEAELAQVTVNLVSVDNLDGGSDVDEFRIYTASGGAVTGVLLDTEGGPSSLPVPAGDHAHANWTFDDPGTYQVTINVTGTGTTPSGNHTFTFEVG